MRIEGLYIPRRKKIRLTYIGLAFIFTQHI